MAPSETPQSATNTASGGAAGQPEDGRCRECGGVLPEHSRSDCTLARHEPRQDGESAL